MIKNVKVIEQLLDIREKVKFLEENANEDTIKELSRLIQESKNLTNKYCFGDATKTKLEKAYFKLNEAENLALEFSRNHKKTCHSQNFQPVFDTFLEGFKLMLA